MKLNRKRKKMDTQRATRVNEWTRQKGHSGVKTCMCNGAYNGCYKVENDD